MMAGRHEAHADWPNPAATACRTKTIRSRTDPSPGAVSTGLRVRMASSISSSLPGQCR